MFKPPSSFCVPPSLPPPPELSLALPEGGFRQLSAREKMKDRLSALWTGYVCWVHLPQPTTESWFKENMAGNISYAWKRAHAWKSPNPVSDKSLYLDLTLAAHRWVHTEVEGKTRQKTKATNTLNQNDQMCIETSSGHERHKVNNLSMIYRLTSITPVPVNQTFHRNITFITGFLYNKIPVHWYCYMYCKVAQHIWSLKIRILFYCIYNTQVSLKYSCVQFLVGELSDSNS